jgi:predicted nuclease of predicted toxin-antitoxin system
MRLLTDENFPLAAAKLLRNEGYDVTAIPENDAGTKDIDILARAVREQRVVLTFDRDFGELVFLRKLPSPPGVVYFRFHPISPLEPATRILDLASKGGIDLLGKFTVVLRNRIRQRELP